MQAGCDDVPITNVVKHVGNPWEFAQAAMPLPVAVFGRPFDLPDDQVVAKTAELMSSAMTWNAAGTVWPMTPLDIPPGVHLSFFYNGVGADPCRAVSGGGPPHPKGKIELQIFLCDGGDILAYVNGRLGGSSGLSDWRFTALVRQATSDLLRPPAIHHP